MNDDFTRAHEAHADEPVDRETARKLGELEQTRKAMHDTVEEIGDRLAPSAIVENAKETVRDATVGKVEDMADTAGQKFSEAGWTAQQAGSGIIETIRRNPIPAAMAGLGLAWLMTHRATAPGTPAWGERRWAGDRLPTTRWREPGMGDLVGDATDSIGRRVSDASDTIGRRASDAGDAMSERLDHVGERVSDVPDQVSYRARDLGEQARTLVDDSPLAVGAVAVAVGTALAAAIPATRTERRLIGPATDRAVGTAERTTREALADAERDLRDMEQETRGRTTSARPAASAGTSKSSKAKPDRPAL